MVVYSWSTWCNQQHFQLKLFDNAVTLKYNQGHWKWCEWVKLKSTTIIQSLTFIIFIVSEKITTSKFLPHTISKPNINTYRFLTLWKKCFTIICNLRLDADLRHEYTGVWLSLSSSTEVTCNPRMLVAGWCFCKQQGHKEIEIITAFCPCATTAVAFAHR